MIKHQKEFEKFLKEERSLTDGSISNYLTYISAGSGVRSCIAQDPGSGLASCA